MAKSKFNAPTDQHEREPAAGAQLVVPPNALIGSWGACDARTRGLVRVDLSASGGGLKVHVFGACTPTPCDWGTVDGIAYAASVSDTEAIAFSAFYKFDFKNTIVTGRIDNGTLIVETYNQFTDGSARSDYYSRGYFCRRTRRVGKAK
jgi:hypothetical protein